MATTTTNFGWDIPQSTDLVKDGATAIAALGQDIDTALVDLKGGTTGQVLAKASNTDLDYTWTSPNPGDITAVTAGTGITGGGTSGDVTVSFDQANYGGGQYAAGKNKLINGDFYWNQRAFTTTTTSNTYGFDRWAVGANDGTTTYSAQTFTAGAAPVAGYEGTNYARLVTTGQTLTTANSHLRQLIEDVRTFAGQTVTVSFWGQAGSGTPKVAVELTQTFGTTGSPSTLVNTYAGQVTLSTAWTRYSVTIAVPSVSGKTITSNSSLTARLFVSAGSDFNSRTGSIGIQTNTFNFWGVQVEAGSQMTPFQTASGGSPQAELAMCQRYYEKSYPQGVAPAAIDTANVVAWNAVSTASNRNYVYVPFKVTKRATPTITIYSPVTGTSAKLYNALTSAGDKNASTNYIQDNSFAIYLGPTDGANAVGDLLLAHYVASAEL